MGIIDIDNAEEGMITVKAVVNEQGNVLLNKGVILTKVLIGKLRSLGISEVLVDEGEEVKATDNISIEESPELKELEYRFSDVRGNEIMEELMAAVKDYIMEKSGNNGEH
jgi:hypothetical protein